MARGLPETNNSAAEEDSDDDFDWEEVAVPVEGQAVVLEEEAEPGPSAAVAVRENIEITLLAKPKKDEAAKARSAALYAERVARLNCHKAHTILLLGNASTRNKWLNDDLLKARLLSLTPMSLQNSFAMIHKSRIPEAVKRGRMFESALTRLAEWWYKTFDVLPTGHIRNRTYEDVNRELAARASARKGKGRARDTEDEEDEDAGEVIKSEKSLMKHALMRRGCRDTSAQLFTALCRALGIPARLVVSLQSVPWQANVGKSKTTTKKKVKNVKGKQKATEDDEGEDMEMEEVQIPGQNGTKFPGSGQSLSGSASSTPSGKGKGKQKAPPVITLRKTRGRKLGTATPPPKPKRELTPEPTSSAPVFWTEVFSRADAKWLPVDPVRFIVNKRKAFDPSLPPSTPPGTRVENRMVYVVAFEEDGYARDVTPRYATEFGAKVSKMQQGGKGKQDWWERVMAIVRRPYRLNRDDLEDDELHVKQMTEQMPNTMTGFKNHPIYVLARHLKRDEVIHPLVELGKFRGEAVYPRSSVVSLKAAENWMRQGRKVREGCQPMKWVKQHAVTVNKRRAIEMAMSDRHDGLAVAGEGSSGFSGEKDVMQGLYAESQTELYQPPPVVDGKVPKNDFGNIDLYVPTMLPEGAAYIPYKGAVKIARQLGFDHAEAVTGFEFKNRRAFPVITGVVVAAENEQALLEAFWAAEQEAEQKRQTKRQEQVIKRWQRLVHGLRIRQRLQEQYAAPDRQEANKEIIIEVQSDHQQAGGFLNTADDVVQPYTLPRNLHEVISSPIDSNGEEHRLASSEHRSREGELQDAVPSSLRFDTFDIEDSLEHHDPSINISASDPGAVGIAAPKTMRELAELAEGKADSADPVKEEYTFSTAPGPSRESSKAATTKVRNGRSARSGTRTPATGTPVVNGNGGANADKNKVVPRRRGKRNREETVPDSEDEVLKFDDSPKPSTKRPRKTKIVATPVKSDRVLRTRTPKIVAQLQEQRAQEEAYRKAIS